MTRSQLVEFIRMQPWAVEASVTRDAAPQAAVIGVAVTSELELIFDTFDTTRKAQNLAHNPRIALVIGWDHSQTLQLEGVADVPRGTQLERVKATYFERFPDGREREKQPGLIYVRVRPTWLRFSDFRQRPPFFFETALPSAQLND